MDLSNPLPFTVDYDYSYDGIMRSLDFSFARLGLNEIDMLYVHDIGVYTHGEEKNAMHFKALMESGFKALEKLRAEGTIKAFGMGVNEVQVCLDVLEQTKIDCILLAGRHTLLDRSADDAVVAALPENRDLRRRGRCVQFGHFGDRLRDTVRISIMPRHQRRFWIGLRAWTDGAHV